MYKITLIVKSFDQYYQTLALNKIWNLCNFLKTHNIMMQNLPKKTQKIIVLKSPHIDKKSRDQFEIRTYKKCLAIQIYNKNVLLLFSEILKNLQLVGVEIKMIVHSTNYLKNNW